MKKFKKVANQVNLVNQRNHTTTKLDLIEQKERITKLQLETFLLSQQAKHDPYNYVLDIVLKVVKLITTTGGLLMLMIKLISLIGHHFVL